MTNFSHSTTLNYLLTSICDSASKIIVECLNKVFINVNELLFQSGTTVINITPSSSKSEHRILEHLHSTPLPAVINAQVAEVDKPDVV